VEDEHTEIPRGYIADTPERVLADDPGGSGWVTTRVAAEALGVNPRTVRAYIERGDLEARSEGEGIQKAYLVSINSVYAIRERRGASRNNPRRSGAGIREESVRSAASAGRRGETPGSSAGVPAEELTSMIRDLTADLMRRTADVAELRTRLELTSQAESTLQAERERLLEDLARERERADRLEAELRETRGPSPEPQEVPETAPESAGNEEVAPEPQEPAQRRSWLHRVFFGT
jgi:hypothetical protein